MGRLEIYKEKMLPELLLKYINAEFFSNSCYLESSYLPVRIIFSDRESGLTGRPALNEGLYPVLPLRGMFFDMGMYLLAFISQ